LILWIVWLSILKSESTMWHIHAKLSYIWEIINNPLWHWLWTSGPAVHHEWTMLPENYFMQVMLDIWTVWFIIWAIVIFQILIVFNNIKSHFQKKDISVDKQIAFLHRKALYVGRSALLVMWLFLHVFEDSMVNYLFFISFGLLSGYLSTFYKKNKSLKINDLFSKK
jgi:hypothetical protein